MEKKLYEQVKDIRNRIATGQTTTFSERNIVAIIDTKKRKKEKKLRKLVTNPN